MPFVDLLHPAGDVEFHDFDQALVFEICHRRIVERDVPVLSDAHAAEIDRLSLEQRLVALALGDRFRRVAAKIVEYLRVHLALHTLAHVAPKTGRMILIDAEVLIHVKQRHFAPVDAAQLHEGFQELNL